MYFLVPTMLLGLFVDVPRETDDVQTRFQFLSVGMTQDSVHRVLHLDQATFLLSGGTLNSHRALYDIGTDYRLTLWYVSDAKNHWTLGSATLESNRQLASTVPHEGTLLFAPEKLRGLSGRWSAKRTLVATIPHQYLNEALLLERAGPNVEKPSFTKALALNR